MSNIIHDNLRICVNICNPLFMKVTPLVSSGALTKGGSDFLQGGLMQAIRDELPIQQAPTSPQAHRHG